MPVTKGNGQTIPIKPNHKYAISFVLFCDKSTIPWCHESYTFKPTITLQTPDTDIPAGSWRNSFSEPIAFPYVM